jgi:hypothetical protein
VKTLVSLAKSIAILASFSILVSLPMAPSGANALSSPQIEHTGNAFADLVVGVPLEDLPIGGFPVGDVGAIHMIYGFPQGLSAQDNEIWHQSMPSSQDQAEAGDLFGSALATGDFNGDGYYDLAIGVPFENLPEETSAGAVHIIYSSDDGVLTSIGNQFITQDTAGVEGDADFSDQFGRSLAVGNFNGDDYDDLAIGVPYEDFESSSITDAGVVNVIYGSSSGLDPDGDVVDQMWHQDRLDIIDHVETGDWFGYALASGDFDSDGYDDLAIGAPGESSDTKTGIGVVHIIYGTNIGLTAADNQQWEQYDWGYGTESESLDHFGKSLAVGNYNGHWDSLTGYDDLAIGVPDEDIELPGETIIDAGAVNVLFGGSSGLSMDDVFFIYQDEGMWYDEDIEFYDQFGYTLAALVDDHGYNDFLVVGCPYEDKGPAANPEVPNAGAVYLVQWNGAQNEFDGMGGEPWYQGSLLYNIPDGPVADDLFGFSLAVGDFDANGIQDLAIGVPDNDAGASGAGAVVVGMVYRPEVFREYVFTIWRQGAGGLVDSGETNDGFGHALAVIPSSGPLPFRIYLPLTMNDD